MEKTKIVIVDDEKDLCFLLAGMLQNQGHEVYSYYDLKGGMKGIESVKPHWIIMDNDLPDGRGWNETQKILELLPRTKIIMISANPDSLKENLNERLFYLFKPIKATSIVDLIGRQAQHSSS